MTRAVIPLVWLAAAGLSACCRLETREPFHIPTSAEIKAVKLLYPHSSVHWPQAGPAITDPARIEAILAQLRLNNHGYTACSDGHEARETQEYAAALAAGPNSLPRLMFFIGPDWLGGFDEGNPRKSRYRHLSKAEHDRLVAVFGFGPVNTLEGP